MRSGRLATAVVCGCFLALPLRAADPPKDVDGDNLPSGQFVGKLTTTPGTDGSFTMQVEIDRVELKPGAGRTENREVQQLLRDEQRIEMTQGEIARSRNRSEYQRLVRQLAGEMGRLQAQSARLRGKGNNDYTIKKDAKEIDFHTADEVKVRIMNPPLVFDDKGNAKEYTKDELKAMKGKDADLPGYESKLESLKVGDTIKVTLATPKPAKKDGDADPKPDPEAKKGHEITMILILTEENNDNGNPKAKKKK